MSTRMTAHRASLRRAPFRGVVAAAVVAVLLGGCASTPEPPSDARTASVSVVSDLRYDHTGDRDLLLNACLPPKESGTTAAVVLVHGGGFEKGNKDSGGMTQLCTALADAGFAAFAVDYRLAPDFVYPAQVDDVGAAIEWLRRPAQVAKFGIDPERIGVFGSSAGAIMAASVGTAGEGELTSGSRVASVVALSPAADFTATGLELGSPSSSEVKLILQYLGCRSISDCAVAEEASPIFSVDESDPPFFIAVSENEIVPEEQAAALSDALSASGVPVTFETRSGSRHAIQLLDRQTMAQIMEFLTDTLGGPSA